MSTHAEQPDTLSAVLGLLHERLGTDLAEYKTTTVLRRIDRRMRLHGYEHVEQYLARLENDTAEAENLYRDLLIGVTRFFRDPAAFEVLANDVIPALVERGAASGEIRVWVAGCATGEEAYSIAILIAEALEELGSGRPAVTVFATDVHHGSLAHAAEGWYQSDALDEIGHTRLERFFVRDADGYRVTPELRAMITFARHNLLTDPPLRRFDLISCRNLLIYIQPESQQRILSLFHLALTRDGFLFLGPSESLGGVENEFAVLDQRWKLYGKLGDIRLGPLAQQSLLPVGRGDVSLAAHRVAQLAREHELLRLYDDLMAQFVPAGILLDDKGRIVHVFGDAGAYLDLAGRPSIRIVDSIAPDLVPVVSALMNRALMSDRSHSHDHVRGVINGEERRVHLTATPIRPRGSRSQYVFLAMRDAGADGGEPPCGQG